MKIFETQTKCKQFVDFFEKEIASGRYSIGSRIPSERILSKKYKIAHMTVNKAISMLVAKGLLKRVYGDGTYVREMDENLASRTVGVVMGLDPKNHLPHIFSNLMTSFSQDRGYFLTHFDSSRAESLAENLPKFLAEKPRGLLVHGDADFRFESLKGFTPATRLVFFMRCEKPVAETASYVLCDFEHGGRMAAEHLINLKRKKLLLLSCERAPGSGSESFCSAFESCAMENGIDALNVNSNRVDSGYYEKLFASADRPDGVASYGDSRVIPLLGVLKKLRLKMPQDVAVIGYYNTPWAEAYNLTSVSVDENLMIEKSWEELLNGQTGRKVLIKPKFVFRKSCPEA